MPRLPKKALILSSMLLVAFLVLGCSENASPIGGTTTDAEEAEAVPEDAPVVIETLEEVPKEDPAVEIPEEASEEAEEPLPKGPTTIEILNDKFGIDQITVSVGDTLVWKNSRTGSGGLTGALILGVRNCANVRSAIFKPGNSFSWTFTEPETCMIVEGIKTTMPPMTVVIE